jgi:hypothetical protein
VPDRNGKIFYTSITSLSHISKRTGDIFMKKIDKNYFARVRVGLFTHYTYPTYAEGKGTNWGGTVFSGTDMSTASSAEEAAALFDGEAFADTANALGAEYVVFTVCHAGFNLLFPSRTMAETGCTWKCTEQSDVVAKLLTGLGRYGIPLVLYMPPNDDHDICDDDLELLGWMRDGREDREARMEFHKRLIREIYERYGSKSIAGFWFDQGGPDASVCYTVRECNPDAVVFVNTGVTANTVKHPNSDFIVSEYYGSIEGCDSDTLPVHYSQVNRQIGGWYATGGKAPTDARNLYRYTVRTIAVEGQFNCGIAWSCGPYLNQTWVEGVRELLYDLGALLRSREGIFGTVPGRSYTTAPNSTLDKSHWGVSTEAEDGSVVWLHVLNRPADGILHLGKPADGRIFAAAYATPPHAAKSDTGYERLSLKNLPDGGYEIVMPEIDFDDGLDTVIRLV